MPTTEPTMVHTNIQGVWHNRDPSPNTCGLSLGPPWPTLAPERGRSMGQDLEGKAKCVDVPLIPLLWGHQEVPTVHQWPEGSHLACRWVSSGWGAGTNWANWDCWKTGEGLLRLPLGCGGSL